MNILIGSDHAGFELKAVLVDYLTSLSFNVLDMGANKHEENDDYPTIIAPIALKIAERSEDQKAIIIGGSGQGEAMVANRFPGVRAALYHGGNLAVVKLAREHNDANILSLGARFVTVDEAKEAVKIFLETAFSKEERHERRINQIDSIA